MDKFNGYSDARLEDALCTWAYIANRSAIPAQAVRAARMVREINAEIARRATAGTWGAAVLAVGAL